MTSSSYLSINQYKLNIVRLSVICLKTYFLLYTQFLVSYKLLLSEICSTQISIYISLRNSFLISHENLSLFQSWKSLWLLQSIWKSITFQLFIIIEESMKLLLWLRYLLISWLEIAISFFEDIFITQILTKRTL